MTKRIKTQRVPTIAGLHANDRRTMTRRELLARSLISGAGILVGPSLLSLFGGARDAHAADCKGPSKAMPGFLCFDLAGGSNIAGSNVMVGLSDTTSPIQGKQTGILQGVGYNKLGIATGSEGNLVTIMGVAPAADGDILFHRDSALLAGIRLAATDATLQYVNGCVLCTRSNDDTQNNPHNPTYGIAKVAQGILDQKARDANRTPDKLGSIVALVGTQTSVSGGNSVAPASQIDAKLRPTKVASGRDAKGLVDSGKLVDQLKTNVNLAVASIEKISGDRRVLLNEAQPIQDALNAAYSGASEQIVCNSTIQLDTTLDPYFVGGTLGNGVTVTGIHQDARTKSVTAGSLLETTRNSAYRLNGTTLQVSGDLNRTSAVSKLVVDGYAGAGTVQMGGFDYHTGDRVQGDKRDMEAGFAIGTALEYARIQGRPLMVYIFSDGAVSSDGKVDPAATANGKLVWTSDNGSCGATVLLAFHPTAKPSMKANQLGGFQSTGSVDTKAAAFSNSVQTLAETVALNYLALSGNQGQFNTLLKGNSLSSVAKLDDYIAFNQIVTV